MATLTKKDLLEAIEDMPENLEVWTLTNALCYEVNRVELKTLWVENHIFDFPWYDSECELSSKDIVEEIRKAMEE